MQCLTAQLRLEHAEGFYYAVHVCVAEESFCETIQWRMYDALLKCTEKHAMQYFEVHLKFKLCWVKN